MFNIEYCFLVGMTIVAVANFVFSCKLFKSNRSLKNKNNVICNNLNVMNRNIEKLSKLINEERSSQISVDSMNNVITSSNSILSDIKDINTETEMMIVNTQDIMKKVKKVIEEFVEQKTNYIIMDSEEVANRVINELCENTDFVERLSKILQAYQ